MIGQRSRILNRLGRDSPGEKSAALAGADDPLQFPDAVLHVSAEVAGETSMRIVLGSQSPQRYDLLKSVVPENRFEVIPPVTDQEPGFKGLRSLPEIEDRLRLIVKLKFDDVSRQLRASDNDPTDCCVICADTVVVATSCDEAPVVLGKPPEKDWQQTVRAWFIDYYSHAPHQVWTCFRIGFGDRTQQETVKTELVLRGIDEEMIRWYLSTGEPVGKAGGYGVQGIAALFVDSMIGSLTNVVGLPMLEVATALRKFGVISMTAT